ncbi:GAF and ANTAR domain-containing protein [Labedaea rhizosphaerae]|uniref:GAF domain-containing protein n=1 Tax=Labedaea rhizosphaerae TaxID=598644 RepID=A0A4R6S0S6_LABRH|nr:GAF and ANTAR domain-containing protein [Labedaea rhizosphaerae]TDP92804.1 GAF domain-containing protein [Labedaea rhizosphaerae]
MREEDWIRDKAEFVAEASEAPHPADHAQPSPLARQFARLAEVLLAADSVADVLTRVVSATLALVPDADLVSLTLRSPDGQLHTPVETDPVATELDDLQQRFDEGPCLDAARIPGAAYTHSADLTADDPWPRFGPAAARHGFRSVLSTALLPHRTRLSGALNIYSKAPGELGDEVAVDRALLLATHASLAVAHTEAVRLADLRAAHLTRALESRDVIGQAKGVLMNRRGITADQAFDLLRRTSQELNVKLATLAHTVATRHAELDRPSG